LRQEGKISADDFEVRFLGSNVVDILMPLVQQYKLDELVNLSGTVPYSESVKKQMESTALLLLKWNEARVKGFYFGKTFEYLGASRPILAVGAYDDEFVDQLMMKSGIGIVLHNADEIKACLTQWLEEYKKTGRISSHFDPNVDFISRYTRRKQAEKLAQLLDEVSGASP
jgi:hypothetical protein